MNKGQAFRRARSMQADGIPCAVNSDTEQEKRGYQTSLEWWAEDVDFVKIIDVLWPDEIAIRRYLPVIESVLQAAKTYYEQHEVLAGCDHGAGICQCNDRHDYERLCHILELVSKA
jgi:hypothetical protein